MDEANEIAPGETVLDRSDRALITKRPYFMEDGLETNAVFIDRPQFDGCTGEGGRHLA